MGNIISDFVKGRTRFDYPPAIQQGIELHRRLDTFTDHHPATRAAREIFRPKYRLYSGALVDVIYDYYLANDGNEFDQNSLMAFSKKVYSHLDQQAGWFPPTFALVYPYMRTQNWLYHYRSREGIGKSLGGLVRRAKYLTESQTAFDLFERHDQLLGDCYRQFWQDVKAFAKNELKRILSV